MATAEGGSGRPMGGGAPAGGAAGAPSPPPLPPYPFSASLPPAPGRRGGEG